MNLIKNIRIRFLRMAIKFINNSYSKVDYSYHNELHEQREYYTQKLRGLINAK